MATNWTFISAASDVTLSNTATVTATPTPNAGDLLVMSWVASRNTTGFTGATIIDNGSGGWQQISPLQAAGTFTSQQCWWKVATQQDDNVGSAFTVTVVGTGGSGTTWTQYAECDLFRLPVGYRVAGIDISRATVGLTSVTNVSWSPLAGSSFPSITDALAWTSMSTALEASNGGVAGLNEFTGTSSAANLAVCVATNDTVLLNQYVGGVQASATAGSNTWRNNWTTSRGPIVTGATFVYTTETGLSVPQYSVQVSMTDPYDTPDWIDITRWVKSGSVKRGRQHELQRAVAGTCALTISNQDGRFSTFNAASPYVNLMTSADSYFQDVTIGDATPGSWGNAGHCTLNTVASKGYDGYSAMSMVETGSAGVMTATTATGTSGYAVTANATYGFQIQVLSAAFTRSVNATASWYTSGGTFISTSSGAQVTSSLSAYTKATLTAVAPSNAAFVAVGVSINSSSSGDTHYVTRVMISNADQQGNVVTAWAPGGRGLVPARPVQVLATSNLTAYPVYYGYVDSWVPAYSGPVLSDQVINCTDGLNFLALAYITTSYYATQVVADGALGYWRLGEQTPSNGFADSSGNFNPMASTTSVGVTPTSGALSSDTNGGQCIIGPNAFLTDSATFASAGPAWTAECWVQTVSGPTASMSLGIMFVVAGSGSIPLIEVVLENSPLGAVSALTTDIGGVQVTGPAVNDGNWHHVVVTFTAGGTLTLYVDGMSAGSSTTLSGALPSPVSLFVGPGPSNMGPTHATFNSILSGNGTVNYDEVAIYGTALSASQIAIHYALGVQGFIQQQSGQRVGAVLTALGIPSSLQNLATGISAVQAPVSSLVTTPALSYIQTVENTEQGFFFVDEEGNFTFLDRHYILLNSAATISNGTFANDTNPTHFKFLEGLIPADDALDLWNDAPVSATANDALGVTGDVQDAPNLDSQRWYGSRTIPGYASMLQTTDAEALELSQWLIAHYGLPLPRVRQIKLDSSATSPSSIPQMLGRQLWDAITVQWQPMDGTTSPFIQASLIESIQHDFSPDVWTTTWGLSVAETQLYFVLNDSVRGTLAAANAQTGNRLGFGF